MRPTKWLWLAVLAGLLIALVAVVQQVPSKHVAKVASVQTWQPQDPGRPSSWPYFWLSDQEILFFRSDERGNKQGTRLNVKTGLETMTKLRLPADSRARCLSPDKQWLLWDSESRPAVAAAVDGSREVTWHHPRLYNPLWTPDSRRWIDMTWKNAGPSAAIGSLNTAQVQFLPLPGTRNVPWNQRNVPHLWGFTKTGQAFTSVRPGVVNREQSLKVKVYKIGSKGTTPQQLTVHAPPDTDIGSFVVSPHGDKIAWVTSTLRQPNPVLTRLNQMFPFFRVPPVMAHRLWVSSLDGGNPRLLYQYRAAWRDVYPRMPQWTPNGKKLSLIHDNALWVVSVD